MIYWQQLGEMGIYLQDLVVVSDLWFIQNEYVTINIFYSEYDVNI